MRKTWCSPRWKLLALTQTEQTEPSIVDTLFAEKESLRASSYGKQAQTLNSPAYIHLINATKEPDEEGRIDLLALGWLGAGLFPNWRRSIGYAEKFVLRKLTLDILPDLVVTGSRGAKLFLQVGRFYFDFRAKPKFENKARVGVF